MPANRSRTARRRPPRRVVPSLVATALAVLLIPLPAVAGSSPVEPIETALCAGGGATVKLTGSITDTAYMLHIPLDSNATCSATLDLDGFTLSVRNVLIRPGSTFTIADTSSGAAGVLNATNAPANDAGIRTTGATLNITGGTMNATGGNNGAGIGGGLGAAGGSVTISGGAVTATGGVRGAGIGAGSGGANGGTVTISGGTINATGGNSGAGIGGGDAQSEPSIRGTGAAVNIRGGTVIATGGVTAAGIGGGGWGGNGGTLTVTGGTVTATGDVGGAGIGGGGANGGVDGAPPGIGDGGGDGGTVTIRGGTVIATGGAPDPSFGAGAGIGGGGAFHNTSNNYRYSAGAGATALIEGGIVTATAGSVRATTIGPGGDLGDDDLAGAAGTLTLGASAVRTDDLPTATTPRTIIAFGAAAATPTAPSTPVLTGGALPALPAGGAAWNRADGTITTLPATASGARAVTYGTAPASVTVTGAPGTTATRGVVADPNGELGAEVCTALPGGSVIEVWVLSTPRLVAAHRVTDAPCQRFAVPFAAPLDAGGPVAAGTHTLQFALATAGGMEAFDIGITVGGPVPNVVPAGEGGAPGTPALLLAVLAVLLAVALVTIRGASRPVVEDAQS